MGHGLPGSQSVDVSTVHMVKIKISSSPLTLKKKPLKSCPYAWRCDTRTQNLSKLHHQFIEPVVVTLNTTIDYTIYWPVVM
jgi:hypothetical protein